MRVQHHFSFFFFGKFFSVNQNRCDQKYVTKTHEARRSYKSGRNRGKKLSLAIAKNDDNDKDDNNDDDFFSETMFCA